MSARFACALLALCILQGSAVPTQATDFTTFAKVASSLIADNDHTLLNLVAHASGLGNIKQCVGKYAPELGEVAKSCVTALAQCPGYVLSDLGKRRIELVNATSDLGAVLAEVGREIGSSCKVSQPLQAIKCIASKLREGAPLISKSGKRVAVSLAVLLRDMVLLPMHTGQCSGRILQMYGSAAGEVIVKIKDCVRGDDETGEGAGQK